MPTLHATAPGPCHPISVSVQEAAECLGHGRERLVLGELTQPVGHACRRERSRCRETAAA